MNIVVTTPTGHIGSRVTQLLIQAGVRPIVLARDPSRLAPEVRAASEVRQGDLSDSEFVLRATRDADALFWLIPTDVRSDDPVAGIVRQGERAAEAIRRNGIARTILLSSAGADRRDGSLIGALGQAEALLDATGASVLHLRPSYFFTNLLLSVDALRQGVLPTTVPLDRRFGWNDPRDVGDVAAALLLSGAWSGSRVQLIHGPRELTFAEVAGIVSEAVGRSISALPITEEAYRDALLGAGMGAPAAEAFVRLERRLGEGIAPEFGPTFVSTTPTTLGAWAYENLRPLLR